MHPDNLREMAAESIAKDDASLQRSLEALKKDAALLRG